MREFIVETDLDLSCVTEFTGAGGISFKPHGELIRCKDCKWYKTNYSWNGKEYRVCVIEPYEPARKADDFCSRAERKEE